MPRERFLQAKNMWKIRGKNVLKCRKTVSLKIRKNIEDDGRKYDE